MIFSSTMPRFFPFGLKHVYKKKNGFISRYLFSFLSLIEEFFRRLSLVLRRGKEDIERVNQLLSNSGTSLPSRRQGQIPTIDLEFPPIDREELKEKVQVFPRRNIFISMFDLCSDERNKFTRSFTESRMFG